MALVSETIALVRVSSTLLGVGAGLAAGALWGLVFMAPQWTPGLSAVDLTVGRFLTYGLTALLAMALTGRRARLPDGPTAWVVLGLSLLGATGYYALLAQSVRWAGVEVPTLIVGTIPVWVMLLGRPAHLSWARLTPGLLLTTAGVMLMAWQAWLALTRPDAAGVALGTWPFATGLGMAALACASWTAFAMLNAAWLRAHPSQSATEWANWLGLATGVGALVLWLVGGSDLDRLAQVPAPGQVLLVVVATGFGSAWLAGILWNVASQRLSMSLCGQLIVSETLFSLAYSAGWQRAWPTTVQALAALLFVLGVLASVRAHATPRRAHTPRKPTFQESRP